MGQVTLLRLWAVFPMREVLPFKLRIRLFGKRLDMHEPLRQQIQLQLGIIFATCLPVFNLL